MATYRSFVRTAFDRLIEARTKQAEREIARHSGFRSWDSFDRGRKHS